MASDAYFPFPDGIQLAAQRGRHRDHPARRLDPRRDGDRGRRPPPPGDGLHRPTALPPLMGRTAVDAPRAARRSTEEARWNSCWRSRWSASPRRPRSPSARVHGPRRPARGGPRRDRGDARDDGRDRDARHDRHRRGRARRGADALDRRAGRAAARGGPGGHARGRHRGRPARGHEPRGDGPGERDHGPRRVGEGRPRPRPGHVPREAVRRARSRPAASTSPSRPTENVHRIAEALGRRRQRHHGDHPRPAAPRGAHRGGPPGRRADQAHLRRRPVGRDRCAVSGHRRPRGDGHRRRARKA